MSACVQLLPVTGLPMVRDGDDLAALLLEALARDGTQLRDGDVLAVAQKVVSKAEGRVVRLADVVPSDRAVELATRLGKDAAKVEVVLRESRRVVKAAWPPGRSEGLLVTEHRLGLVMANAGIDESNLDDPGTVLLLPEAPDDSAEQLRSSLSTRTGARVAVVITDTFGRPWRLGIVNVAIGVAGMPAVEDLRGRPDSAGRELTATVLALADEVAAAAGLVQGKTAGIPAVVIRGLTWQGPDGRAMDLVRPAEEDAFR